MVEVLQAGRIQDVVTGELGEVVPLLFGHDQLRDQAVEPDLHAGQAGGLADAAKAASGGGVCGERVGELVGVDGVGVDTGPRHRGRWRWVPGDGFVDVVSCEQVPGLGLDERAHRWG